ncbi:MAG: hypothetical protein AYK22_05170 [Thermoplasmatales archaeon SG8-52-3]|nr:MAG: hypothetical protein AYK22_05170 [Thermoplasmatales archaeon SG8-52-3]
MVRLFQRFYNENPVTEEALEVILYNNIFRKHLRFLRESQKWKKIHLEEYQQKQLSRLLNHSYRNVPYYKNLFDKFNIEPNEINSIKDLKKIPFLTKQIVKENVEEIKAANYPLRKFKYTTTGGSTGFPLGFFVEKGVAKAKNMAFYQSLLDNAGCFLTEKHAYFIGYNNIYRYQFFRRIMVLSSFFITDDNLPIYINKLRKFKPKFIMGFTSAITNLARYMDKNSIDFFPSIKTVVCAGETLFDWQRDILERTFQCRVHALYDHFEQAVFGTTCEYSNYYHLYPQYGITELVHEDGTPVVNEDEEGEIVATGFNNFIFPFIRYKTGDIGILTHKKCKCGRDYLLLKSIEGRKQEIIVSKEKRYISLTGFYGLIAKFSKNVKDCQIAQEKEGEILLFIVKEKDYTKKDEDLIIKNFKDRFKGEIDIVIQYVDNIPRTAGGKFKFLIQKLSVEY